MLPKTIIYTPQAQRNLIEIAHNIVDFAGLESAIKVIGYIRKSVNLLAEFPEMGVQGIVKGTREIYPRRYRVVYKETEQNIIIITIMHGKRLYPR
ncbi:plasmid stabilization system protein, RelE/ParE family [Actinobacillus ureae ATCC 25976]|uniref:Plasmid stabilization system protein, RelE/ParE family n=1 Tax=Actinobacillus ureae ATCC 25976 TaxID=887324 RepID=E8KHM6_9PAST|nr:type II toxin-antitoxin system RelE/ParE family toxin [Actinobacillus ureae]EFX91584.1 plasmid stabilization system protein, RelE/ParE family [Actinobacillus ureae ATCC 25976]